METIVSNVEKIGISENYIKQLQSILLRHSQKDQRHRGEYKKYSNSVEAFSEDSQSLGVVLETTSAFDTPKSMHAKLVYWTR